VGTERYGALALLWALTGYLGFVDFGLGRAISQRLASMGSDSVLDQSGLIWTALAITLFLGVVFGSLIWLGSDLIVSRLGEVRSEYLDEARSALAWLAVATPIIVSAPVLHGALHGRQQFMALNILSTLGATLSQILPLLVASMGHVSLDWLVPAALLARLLTFLLSYWCCKCYLPMHGLPHFDLAGLGPLLKFGGWVSISGIMAPLLTTIDRLLIGFFDGLSAVAQYAIPMQVTSKLTIFSGSYSSALFPVLAAENDSSGQSEILSRLTFLSAVLAPGFIFSIFYAGFFFEAWIGQDLSATVTPVAEILILGYFFNSLAILIYSYLQAKRRPDVVAKIQLAQLPVYLIMLFYLLHYFGIYGAALATSIRMLMGFSLQVLVVKRGWGWEVIAAIWPSLALVILAPVAVRLVGNESQWLVITSILYLSVSLFVLHKVAGERLFALLTTFLKTCRL